MQRLRSPDTRRPPESAVEGARSAAVATPRSEALHLRNYDHRRGYALEVTVSDPSVGPVFRERYRLRPGELRSECDVGTAGAYELRVSVVDGPTKTLDCRIGSEPAHTAVVELGNGALSLTEGIPR